MKRKLIQPPTHGGTVHPTLAIGRTVLERGAEVRVRGERGRFLFLEHVEAPAGSWVTVCGPLGKHEPRAIRSFPVPRIRRP